MALLKLSLCSRNHRVSFLCLSVRLGLTSSIDDRFEMSLARVQQRDIKSYTKERNLFALCWICCVESLFFGIENANPVFRLPSWSLIASTH